MNTQAVRTAPRSPWQNASAERVVGSIRRACLDHIIAINETGLRRVLTRYIAYYMESRTHLALDREGRAGHTTSRARIGRPNRRDPASGRAPSPLRSRSGLIVRRCFLAPDIRSATELNAAGSDVAHLDAIAGRSEVPSTTAPTQTTRARRRNGAWRLTEYGLNRTQIYFVLATCPRCRGDFPRSRAIASRGSGALPRRKDGRRRVLQRQRGPQSAFFSALRNEPERMTAAYRVV
jgi:hypothetical protein